MTEKTSKFVVGLTGGIGSGKTTITNIFADFGIDIIDADIVAREVVEPGSKALSQIVDHFGKMFINDDGQLNRPLLRRHIFNNDENKQWLNNLLHPLIRQGMLHKLNASTSEYCILVAPLLIENKLDKLVNRVLVIDVSEKIQIERTTKRDPSSREEVQRIIKSQISREDRLAKADDIIDNNCNYHDFDEMAYKHIKNCVIKLHQKYQQLAKKHL